MGELERIIIVALLKYYRNIISGRTEENYGNHQL
jgi:hypothetical protein